MSLRFQTSPGLSAFEDRHRLIKPMLRRLLRRSPLTEGSIRRLFEQTGRRWIEATGTLAVVLMRRLPSAGLLEAVASSEPLAAAVAELRGEVFSDSDIPALRELNLNEEGIDQAVGPDVPILEVFSKANLVPTRVLGAPVTLSGHLSHFVLACGEGVSEPEYAFPSLCNIAVALSLLGEHHRADLNPDLQTRVLARITGCPVWPADGRWEVTVRSDTEEVLAHRGNAVFVRRGSGRETREGLVMVDPLDRTLLDELRFEADWTPDEILIGSPARIAELRQDAERLRRKLSASVTEAGSEAGAESPAAGAIAEEVEAPSALEGSEELVRAILQAAAARGASDIHVEPAQDGARVRFRVDGLCELYQRLPKSRMGSLINRIKVLAELNIAEHRRPQDGRVNALDDVGFDLGLRVSIVPTVQGESAVLRLLDNRRAVLPLTRLGLEDEQIEVYREGTRRTFGMILHSGPTGSGKSMCLYAALNELRSESNKILTAEDPVEFQLDGLQQVPVNPAAGVTFAGALRAFLRQDPDIILVGEMRDKETAATAIDAAMTGHLLFSTVHANSALETVERVARLGVERELLGAALILVCAQRLARRVCRCRNERPADRAEARLLRRFGRPVPERVATANGCPRCRGRGYSGRTGLFELLPCDDELAQDLTSGQSTLGIAHRLRERGMVTLAGAAARKLERGLIDLPELHRVVDFGPCDPPAQD